MRDVGDAAATLLEQVVDGVLDASVALELWPEWVQHDGDPLLTTAWHALSHYATDTDIRTLDPRYRDYQNALLLRRAREIRSKFSRPRAGRSAFR